MPKNTLDEYKIYISFHWCLCIGFNINTNIKINELNRWHINLLLPNEWKTSIDLTINRTKRQLKSKTIEKPVISDIWFRWICDKCLKPCFRFYFTFFFFFSISFYSVFFARQFSFFFSRRFRLSCSHIQHSQCICYSLHTYI